MNATLTSLIQKIAYILIFTFSLSSCQFAQRLEEKVESMDNYEQAALVLAKENRELQADITRYKYEINSLKTQINYLEMKLSEDSNKKSNRSLASENIPSVDFDTYHWSPEQLLLLAKTHFNKSEFKLASDYYHALILRYPNNKKINDQIYFEAGMSSYKSGDKTLYPRAIKHLDFLISNFPNSPYFRGAKLWLALSQEKMGNRDFFFNTVDEFRKKYRNTEEWKVLSGHYENIRQHYKK